MDKIQFRSLEVKDISQLHAWLNTDFVIEWYGKKSMTIDDVKEHYTPYIMGKKPTQAYISMINDIDVGYIQTYFICDYPDYNEYVNTDDHAAGVDLFIGHKDYIHKGYGTFIMKEFLRNHVFTNSVVDKCIIGPEPKNLVAIKMYEKSGFKWYKNIQIPDEDEPEYLMLLLKKDFISDTAV